VEIFPRNLKIPVRADVGAVEKLREEIERDLNLEFYLESRKVARRIKAMLPELEREIQEVYSIELIRGIKEFCQDFTFPEISHKGIGFLEGKNLFIENPQPISYFLGQSDQIHTAPIPEIGNYNVIVLTGANSGGKTSLLELITQIQILAQMGLPVNASRCHIDVVDELFLFRRKKSVYGAGAFENAVKTLSRILQGDGKKLILVDEFEAITEPGAAIRIVSKILEIAHRKGHYFVLVSHLGEHLKFDFVRVDGIEAEGLDDDLNLIVDRQPKFGVVGRSTPELIVERLYRKSKGEIRSIFKELLEAVRRLDKGQEAEEVVEVDDKRG
jgi:dsDNA-specific endonuclease/ATPase MutS2